MKMQGAGAGGKDAGRWAEGNSGAGSPQAGGFPGAGAGSPQAGGFPGDGAGAGQFGSKQGGFAETHEDDYEVADYSKSFGPGSGQGQGMGGANQFAGQIANDNIAAVEIDYHEGHDHGNWPASNFPSKASAPVESTTEAEQPTTSWTLWFFYLALLGVLVFGSYQMIKPYSVPIKRTLANGRKYAKKFWPQPENREELLTSSYQSI
jgi:hypothetical protein